MNLFISELFIISDVFKYHMYLSEKLHVLRQEMNLLGDTSSEFRLSSEVDLDILSYILIFLFDTYYVFLS